MNENGITEFDIAYKIYDNAQCSVTAAIKTGDVDNAASIIADVIGETISNLTPHLYLNGIIKGILLCIKDAKENGLYATEEEEIDRIYNLLSVMFEIKLPYLGIELPFVSRETFDSINAKLGIDWLSDKIVNSEPVDRFCWWIANRVTENFSNK